MQLNVNKKDVIWSYMARCFSLGVNIILLPLILSFLSDTELGLWYVFASVSQIVNLFDFGFSATLSRHMTYAWTGADKLQKSDMNSTVDVKERNEYLVVTVIATCRIVYLVIAIIGLIVMLTAGSAYIFRVLGDEINLQYVCSWFIYAFAIFLNLFYGYWSSLLQGIGAIAERNKMNVYSKIIQLILAVALLFLGWGLLGFVIAYTISGISLRIIGRIYFGNKTRNLMNKQKVNAGEIKECFSTVWYTAKKDGLVMLAQYLSTQANTLICAYYIDLSTTSSYGVITQIASFITSLATAYFSAYQAQYSSACLKQDIEREREITCASSFIYKIIFAVLAVGFIFVGVPLINWIRPDMQFNKWMIGLVCIFYYLHNQHSMFASMIASSNRIPYCKSFMITAVCSVILSIGLIRFCDLGIWGLVIGQLIVNIVYNNWYWPLFIMKELGLKYRDLYVMGFNQVKRWIKYV